MAVSFYLYFKNKKTQSGNLTHLEFFLFDFNKIFYSTKMAIYQIASKGIS